MEVNNLLIYVALALGAALLSRRFTERVKLPMVTGYIIIGVLIGIFHIISRETLVHFAVIDDIVLGLIAFSIGTQLSLGLFKKTGRSIIAIVILEVLGAFVLVAGVSYLWTGKLHVAVMLGAISCATAPAATVVVLEQYKAKGPLTSTILAVVGSDDAASLIFFAFAFALARPLLMQTHVDGLFAFVFVPLGGIVLSVVIGGLIGFGSTYLFGKMRNHDDLLIGTGFLLILAVWIAGAFELSPLLTAMSLGFVLVNRNPFLKHRMVRATQQVTPLFYAIFFIYAGARLDIGVVAVPSVLILALLYTVARGTGKFSGSLLGARMTHAPKQVQKYIGMSLMPQVGVAVAFAIIVGREFSADALKALGADAAAQQAGAELAALIINILLFTTIITETVGPILTKYAIHRAGEAKLVPKRNVA